MIREKEKEEILVLKPIVPCDRTSMLIPYYKATFRREPVDRINIIWKSVRTGLALINARYTTEVGYTGA